MSQETALTPPERKQPRFVTGIVTSDKMQKTRAVQVMRLEQHPKYKKYVRRYTTYKVHDEKEDSHVGDTVRIAPTRPLSKTKRWRLVEVVTRSRLGGLPSVEALGAEAETGGEGGPKS